jgi:hypothetical protein
LVHCDHEDHQPAGHGADRFSFLVRPFCFQEGWRDGSLSLTPRRTGRSFGRRLETLAKVFFCPGDMDVSRGEKSRSGSISDNHSKPAGGDNENTLTNCTSRAGDQLCFADLRPKERAVADPQITQKILAIGKAYDEGENSSDAAAIAALFTEDAVKH